MRPVVIAANWKMNTALESGRELLSGILSRLPTDLVNTEVIVCPPFTHIVPFSQMIEGENIALGAQNLWEQTEGAYTGEISALMLQDFCQYVIVGHSERREYAGETDALVNRKVKRAIAHGLTPILCVGESSEIRSRGDYLEFVANQLEQALAGVAATDPLYVAYEPIWAIGSGAAAGAEQAQEVCGRLRTVLQKKLGEEAAAQIPVLYGGSTTAHNLAEFIAQSDIDGALVGGASLKAEIFSAMVEIGTRARD